MDFNHNFPIYLQIMEQIKKEIILGKKQRGERLPSVREYAGQLKVNVNTMMRVFQELEKADITFTKRGIGTFITESEEVIAQMKREMAEKVLGDFVQGMEELGFTHEDRLEMLQITRREQDERNRKNRESVQGLL